MTKQTKGFTLVELPFDHSTMLMVAPSISKGDRLRTIRKRKGGAFTLVELLVVVAIIALLVAIMLPTLGRAQELTRQTICTSNLKGIGVGWKLYANANRNQPPILPGINQATADYAADLQMGNDCTAAALGTGAQQNLCLLVKAGNIPWDMFLCPSAGTKAADRSGSGREFGLGETAGGTDYNYCDYGIQIPYDAAGANWCPLDKRMDEGIAIMGDRSPDSGDGGYYIAYEWSPNHPDDGESLLYAGGHVKFSKDEYLTPLGYEECHRNTGGWGHNNVYSTDRWNNDDRRNPILIDNRGVLGLPASTKDSVLYWWGE